MRPKRRLEHSALKEGQFGAVIRAYLNSADFDGLAPGTKANYRRVLGLAGGQNTLGAVSVYTIRPALVQAFLDGLSDRPGLQMVARSVLKVVQRYAMVRDLLPREIMTGTYIKGTTDGHEPWPDTMIELAVARAREDLARAVLLTANTGQRGSDIVRMRYGDIEEAEDPLTRHVMPGIRVHQQKTGRKLWVPFPDRLIDAMAGWKRLPPFFLILRPNGTPYTRPQLSWAWNHELRVNKALAPIREAGLVLHGLRASYVVKLRKRGATDLQISNMAGMSEQMVARYSRLADQQEMAMAAVHILNDKRRARDDDKAETG